MKQMDHTSEANQGKHAREHRVILNVFRNISMIIVFVYGMYSVSAYSTLHEFLGHELEKALRVAIIFSASITVLWLRRTRESRFGVQCILIALTLSIALVMLAHYSYDAQ